MCVVLLARIPVPDEASDHELAVRWNPLHGGEDMRTMVARVASRGTPALMAQCTMWGWLTGPSLSL
ncbi:hypothetical protein TIFTF001_004426 [Ficus carica]|uniref:Uncharacterized protein n=1 Tax=Ficus carica TaxID=3494 RepID=A0AA88DCU7_FICCA|nr:hypothetical protein TIFTF001_004426 [Ficus carica]